MGNSLFNDIINYKTNNNRIFWGISSLRDYYNYTDKKNLLEKAEKNYRSCATSQYHKIKLKHNSLFTIKELFDVTLQPIENKNIFDRKKHKFALKYLLRLLTLINIIIFHRNQKQNEEITYLSIVLRKNGLSSTGIDMYVKISWLIIFAKNIY